MSDEYNPNRPSWDTSLPAPLPEQLIDAFGASAKIAAVQEAIVEELEAMTPEQRIARLEAMQTEAINLANSRGASLMTHEQDFIATWTKEATSASGQLFVFMNSNNVVADREAKIADCTRRLATALYKLGRIDEALTIAVPFPDLVSHIEAVRDAIDMPDDELQAHGCARPQADQDGKTITLDRRWATEDVISAKHGKLVHVWECVVCGLANASPDIPERQRDREAQQAEVRQLMKDGKAIPARLKADSVLASDN